MRLGELESAGKTTGCLQSPPVTRHMVAACADYPLHARSWSFRPGTRAASLLARSKPLARIAVALAIGASLSAVQTFPLLSAASRSPRHTGVDSGFWSLHPVAAAETVLAHPFGHPYDAALDNRRRRQERIDRDREQLHVRVAQESTTWCEIEEIVGIDRAYKAILHHAAEAQADLIVMGAQGADGLELMLYGSNTQHVVRAATCPVLTVRVEEDERLR